MIPCFFIDVSLASEARHCKVKTNQVQSSCFAMISFSNVQMIIALANAYEQLSTTGAVCFVHMTRRNSQIPADLCKSAKLVIFVSVCTQRVITCYQFYGPSPRAELLLASNACTTEISMNLHVGFFSARRTKHCPSGIFKFVRGVPCYSMQIRRVMTRKLLLQNFILLLL